MAEKEKNHFILNRVFPDTKFIFNRKERSLDEIFKDALFVLDTNSLLAPYRIGKENVKEIKKIYTRLIKNNRLFIPQHVLREFSKNRSIKIGELFTTIDDTLSKMPSIKDFEYPILGDLEAYKKIKDLKSEIHESLKLYKQHLTDLKSGITDWNWSDPVSSMYSDTFTDANYIDINEKEEDLIKEFELRMNNKIPPGNKDSSKEENAIGDFIIWKSILELGKTEKKSVVFITNDEKNDWLLKGNKKSISTKFELVDEFYRYTEENDFVCMTFQNFLERQGFEIEIIDEFDVDAFLSFHEKSDKIGAFDALHNIVYIIREFNREFDTTDESLYIDNRINKYIEIYWASWENAGYDEPLWKEEHDYLSMFATLLSEIKFINNDILYQKAKMKRDTTILSVELHSLSNQFLSAYDKFDKIR